MQLQRICRVVSNDALCAGTRILTLEAGEIADMALPGQFVHMGCGAGLTLRRPISVCRAGSGELTLVVEERGEGTRRLAALKPGEQADLLGPLGRGFRLPEGRVIVAGGGLGAPPLLYAAMSASGGADAVLGFRSADRLMLEEEFRSVCGEVYITTDDGSYGEGGTIAQPLRRLLERGGYAAVLACGPRPMLRAAAALCAEYGAPCQVSMEERMGCGVGACLVCSCKTVRDGEEHMSRVCKDGPVFDAEEVVW